MADLITAADLAELRAVAAGTFVDTCRVTDPAAVGRTLDEETLKYVDDGPAPVIYEGPCGVDDPTAASATDDTAGREWTTEGRVVKLPPDTHPAITGGASGDIRVGHIIEITTATYDPDLLGRRFKVIGLDHRSLIAARRIRCKEVTG